MEYWSVPLPADGEYSDLLKHGILATIWESGRMGRALARTPLAVSLLDRYEPRILRETFHERR